MGNSSVTETEVRNNRVVHNGETGDVANTPKGRKPPGDCRYTSAEPSFMKIKASAGVPEGPCLIRVSAGEPTCSFKVHLRHVFGKFTGAGGPLSSFPGDVGHGVPATCAITVDEV